MIFVLSFKLLPMFQIVYNVCSIVRNEQKCLSTSKLQKLLWKDSGELTVTKVQVFRAGGASGGREPGKAAVGSVCPQGLAQSCGTTGLPEPSGPPLCQPAKASLAPRPLQEDWVGHPWCGCCRTPVRIPEERQVASVASGENVSQGWPQGQGLGQKWVRDWLCTQVSG